MSRGGRSQGTVTVSGALFNIVIFADAQYLKADASAWRVAGVPPATAQLIADRWLKTSRTSKLGQDFDFTLSALAAELTADVKLAPNVGRSTLDGRPVVVLTDNGKNPGRLYVANTGKPYPVMMEATGAGNAGNLKFTQYDASVTIEAPPTAIPLPEQTA